MPSSLPTSSPEPGYTRTLVQREGVAFLKSRCNYCGQVAFGRSAKLMDNHEKAHRAACKKQPIHD